ncbi:MAG: methyltransferase domain-containing protein [Terracidiphilus sp.]
MDPSHLTGDGAAKRSLQQGITGAIAFHNQLASTWETNYRTKAFLSRVEAIEGALRGRDLHGELWLDAGCGSGTLARWLVGRGAKVVGVDGAPEMVRLALATAKIQNDESSLQFQVANVGAMPFSDGSFEGVLCSSVLEYAEDPASYLKEIARVTKPNGTLLISTPNAGSVVRLGLRVVFQLTRLIGKPRPQYMAYSQHQYSKAQLSALLRRHGYEPDYMVAFGSGMPAWLRDRSWFGRLLLVRAARR